MKAKNVIIGAGITGITLAERFAAIGEDVIIIEKRNHIGGNCYDEPNEDGILIQKYGPHIFHTKIKEVFDYLSKFTEWTDYKHKVIAFYKGEYYPIPINITTINKFFKKKFSSEEAKKFLESKAVKIDEIKNSRDVVVSKVGEELYKAFIEGYTIKQWDMPPEKLDKEVLERLPIRFDENDLYFSDPYQGLPKEGFTAMLKKMLNSGKIKVMLETDYKDAIKEIEFERLFVTCPIDEFFEFKFGKLEYRSIRFVFETHEKEEFQQNSVVNYPETKYDFTRITEFKKLTGQKHPKTTICKEFASWEGEPSYPVPRKANQEVLKKYNELAEKQKNTFFAGRLGTYKYLNMDAAVSSALKLFEELK